MAVLALHHREKAFEQQIYRCNIRVEQIVFIIYLFIIMPITNS